MVDTQTGDIIPIDDLSQETKDKALPRERQGAVFARGDVLDLDGVAFKISGMHRKGLVLIVADRSIDPRTKGFHRGRKVHGGTAISFKIASIGRYGMQLKVLPGHRLIKRKKSLTPR